MELSWWYSCHSANEVVHVVKIIASANTSRDILSLSQAGGFSTINQSGSWRPSREWDCYAIRCRYGNAGNSFVDASHNFKYYFNILHGQHRKIANINTTAIDCCRKIPPYGGFGQCGPCAADSQASDKTRFLNYELSIICGACFCGGTFKEG